MSPTRRSCYLQLKQRCECEVVLITPDNLDEYILNDHPLHPAFHGLSETHKSDYLRTYFMHFHGGGYSDVKCTTGSWIRAFNDMKEHEYCCINGYHEEGPWAIAHPDAVPHWEYVPGNGAYIVRPRTELTQMWYDAMMQVLDEKSAAILAHPASHPQETVKDGRGYPLEWNELLGHIFHRIVALYVQQDSNLVRFSVPKPVLFGYH
jgi:hypothetical protein